MSDAVSLNGMRVLVTRPAGQGEGLIEAIRRAGGDAVSLPLLKIEPVTEQHRQAEIRKLIQCLDDYQVLIFISTNAVRYGLDWIFQYWPNFLLGADVVAVGPTTAAALADLPCEVHQSASGMSSEDILELSVLQEVQGKKIALFRGVGGRELLADTLRRRGARVDYIETYERLPVSGAGNQLAQLLQRERIDAMSVTSGQILDSLCQLVDISDTGFKLIPLLVPSERIRQQAQAAGFVRVVCSRGSTDSAILAGLVAIAEQQSDRPDGARSG